MFKDGRGVDEDAGKIIIFSEILKFFSYLIPPRSKKARPNAIVFKASKCQSSKVSEFEKQPKSFLSHVIIQCYGVATFLPETGAF